MGSLSDRQHTVNTAATARSAAGDAFSALAVQIFRAHGLLVAAGDALARPVRQTTARWQVLAAVEDAPATVAQIARALALARQSVQRVADLLVAEGLAAYADNPAHRRAKLLALTPRGRAALTTIQVGQCAWANAVGAEIGAADLRRTSEILAAVTAALAKHAPRSQAG